jgi:hypothetical protein
MTKATVGVAALSFRLGSAGRLGTHGPFQSFAVFLGVFSLLTAATAVLFCRWLPRLGSELLGPPEDNMQDFWNTWYTSASSGSHFFFTNLIRYPEGTPLYYHSFAYPKIFAISFLWKMLDGAGASSLILLHNISVLASFPLSGAGAFYLVRYLTGSNAGALLGGFVFAFNPSHVQHAMHHIGVSSIEFIPFFILFYLLAIERKRFLLLLPAAALYTLAALSCWYYLFYLAYYMAFHLVYLALRDRALPAGWQLLAPVTCLGGAGALLAPILIPMIAMATAGAPVYIEGADFYVADIFTFPAFPSHHGFGALTDWVYARVSGNEWEATAYLGCVNSAALAWLCFSNRKNSWLVSYVLTGMAVFCVLAAGNTLHVLGYPTIPLPGAVLSQLPFFSNVRAPSRAIVLVYMFLSIGVGHAIGVALKHRPRRAARWSVAAVAFFAVLDFSPVRRLASTPIACSPGLAVIRDDPEKGFGVLDLPAGSNTEENFYMMQQAACHGRPILHGATSRNLITSLRDRLETSDFDIQRRQLVDAKVKYIVLHSPGETIDMTFVWRPREGVRSRYILSYSTVYDSPDLTVLRVY